MSDSPQTIPKLSIIVPAYNQQEFIAETLASVEAQSFGDWECIIIDDGSTDGTRGVVREFENRESRFAYYFQENQGVSPARNHGLERARGKYLLFLDADDTLLPGMTGSLTGALEKSPHAAVAYGEYQMIGPAGEPMHRPRREMKVSNYLERLLLSNLFPLHAAVVRKSVLDDQGIRFSATVRPEDWDFWLRLAIGGAHFLRVDELMCCYRKHPANRSREVMKKTRMAEELLEESLRVASARGTLRRGTGSMAHAALYLRRYAEARKFGDEEAAQYVRGKLTAVTGLHLFGLRRIHWYLLGLFLNVHEQTGEYPLLTPLLRLRNLLRRVRKNWASSRG